MKKTILHIIDNLTRGGAETMLVNVIAGLKQYNHIVVTLNEKNDFGDELICDKLICLSISSVKKSPTAAVRLRKIISQHDVSIVHSHLFWSTIIARMGVPARIPLFSTIHTSVALSPEYKPRWIRLLERATFKIRRSVIIAVSEVALGQYLYLMKVKPYKTYTLYNFVNVKFFNTDVVPTHSDNLFRLVAVGNLKEVKNHHFLLEAFKQLTKENIELDIYGTGALQASLQTTIDEFQLNVHLKGQANNLEHRLKEYDLFVMSSLYEGFSVSILEAMASGLPLLLNDIPSFTEQCANGAQFYTQHNVEDFVSKLLLLKADRKKLVSLGIKAKERVINHYTLEQHLEKLQVIYNEEV